MSMKYKLYTLVGGAVGTNCYILTGEDGGAIVFDIPDGCGGKIADFCAKHQIVPLAVFLTHGHFDHCGGVAEFLRHFGVKVYGNANDAPLAAVAAANRYGVKAENCEITDFVGDGQTVNVGGFSVDVLFTPGHTKGSVCYFIEDMMFSGDTLFHGDIGRTDFPESDSLAMEISLKKLSAIEKNYFVYPGHEESTTLDAEKRENPYLK